ncbi:MAG: amidohydrolase, partial [Alcaligenaceae bacterium]
PPSRACDCVSAHCWLVTCLGVPVVFGINEHQISNTVRLVRRPKLRIAFSHGGGTLASLLPRLQQGWGVFPGLKETVLQAPSEQARKFYYDTLVFDRSTLRHLVDCFGSSQLLVGTDYPFNFHDRTPVERIESAGFDADVVASLLYRNAEAFLGLKKEST